MKGIALAGGSGTRLYPITKEVSKLLLPGPKIDCLEGIAYRKSWISEEKMRALAQPVINNQYGQYLLSVIDEMKEEITSLSFTHRDMNIPQE